jgi:hypothetical protein
MSPFERPATLTTQEVETSTDPEEQEISHRGFSLHKLGPPFWTVTSFISLAINLGLMVLLIVLASQVFAIKQMLNDQLLGGLYQNFALMDQARIKTNIPISVKVPAQFDLPVKTDTTVVLREATTIRGAQVTLITGGLSLFSSQTDIVLPAGTQLPIHLEIVVPVREQIPVNLDVPVDIPLNQTDLHTPFVGLQEVIRPYYSLMNKLPGSWNELMCTSSPDPICNWFFPKQKK